jgi:hypothetical protein
LLRPCQGFALAIAFSVQQGDRHDLATVGSIARRATLATSVAVGSLADIGTSKWKNSKRFTIGVVTSRYRRLRLSALHAILVAWHQRQVY